MSENTFTGFWNRWTQCPRCKTNDPIRLAASNAWHSQESRLNDLVKELRDLKKFSEMHHPQQPDHEICHALTIDIPHRIEVMLEAAGFSESQHHGRAE